MTSRPTLPNPIYTKYNSFLSFDLWDIFISFEHLGHPFNLDMFCEIHIEREIKSETERDERESDGVFQFSIPTPPPFSL